MLVKPAEAVQIYDGKIKIEKGEIVGGFAHNTVLSLTDVVIVLKLIE